MSDLVGNPEDRFFHNEAHIVFLQNVGLSATKEEKFRTARKSATRLHSRGAT